MWPLATIFISQLVYFAVLIVLFIELFWWLATWNSHSQHLQMLTTETDRLSIDYAYMAVADILETRISTRARKGQESQNYLKHDCCRQNKNDIPIKDDTVAEN